MNEEFRIEYCLINIAANPHPPGIYYEILSKISKDVINYRSDLFAAITEPVRIEDGIYQGRLMVWTEVNKSEPAIDKAIFKEVNFGDLDVSIPDYAGFNLRVFIYTLSEYKHYILVETRNELGKTISANSCKKVFSMLIDDALQVGKIPNTSITLVPDEDELRKIFESAGLKKVSITLTRPNSEDLFDDSQKILNEMEEQDVRVFQLELTAVPRKNIRLNEGTKNLMSVASENGRVKATERREGGGTVSYDTQEYPKKIKEFVAGADSLAKRSIEVLKRFIS